MRRDNRFWRWPAMLILAISANLAQAGTLEHLFAPKAEAWQFWRAATPASTRRVDHTDWEQFLQKYVQVGRDRIHRVAYAEVAEQDRQLLRHYIKHLELLPILQYSRPQQLAYWINLYNAVTVDIILRHYPVESIRQINISPGFFAEGPWGKKLLQIEAQQVSLNDIEHRILRPLWRDPRIHYALNCASLGCPNLQDHAYTADNVEALLEQAATDFINHPRGVSIEDGQLTVSSIYSWFQEDFGNNEKEVIGHLLHYAAPNLKKALRNISSIHDDDYDWGLNDSHPHKMTDEE